MPLPPIPGRTLLIRADASAEMGVGHVMRCLALADAWHDAGGNACFALASGASELESQIRSRGGEIAKIKAEPGSLEDAAITLKLAERCQAAWLMVDGYHFSANYLQTLSRATSLLLLMADGDNVIDCRCNICVDMSPGSIDSARFHLDGEPELLLGPNFALLRREFVEYTKLQRNFPRVARSILISIGGGDARNITLQVLRALEEIDGRELNLTVVAGPSNPHRKSLHAAIAKSKHTATLITDARNMPQLMAAADLAITAGGGTCYELCLMQVAMLLIAVADNQQEPIRAYVSAMAAIDGGRYDTLDVNSLSALLRNIIDDQNLRVELARNARSMVDGNGARRIMERMFEVSRRKQKMEIQN